MSKDKLLEKRLFGRKGSRQIFKNWQLIGLENELSMNSSEISEKIGINYATYQTYVTLKIFPNIETQLKICNYFRSNGLDADPKDVFPKKMYLASTILEDEPFESLEDTSKLTEVYPLGATNIFKKELEDKINYALSTLTLKEENILRLKFGFEDEPVSMVDIAEIYNISRERVRQIYEKAIRRMSYASRSRELKEYLDL